MQNTIAQVINGVLREQGLASEPRATRVVEAVSARLAQTLGQRVDEVVRFAVRDGGYDEAEARQVFVNAGLAERPAPVAAPAARSSKKGERISKLEETVERLVRAARARGLSV
jgi:predicted amidohydrolase YtcJ